MKRFLLYILFLFVSIQLSAQTVYPIRTYTTLNPPLPYSLSGFVSKTGKLNVNIFVDDINLEQYAVKFRIHIKGNGIKLTTHPNLYQEPFYLNGAENYTLTGTDFEQLLNPDNLVFEGYSRNRYKQEGRLPEGVYRIWLEVLDYYQNVKVSGETPGIAMIYLAKAPRLSYPLNRTELDPEVMQSIRFSWISILPADPLSNVHYKFKLYEIRPEGRDPYEISNVTQPVFQEETSESSFVYDQGMPPLVSGQWYAWRVEVCDEEKRVLFQNNGLSDVMTFRYGKSCELPDLVIKSVEENKAELAWNPSANISLYTIAYKEKSNENWQEKSTRLSRFAIDDLKDNTAYQVKLKAACGDEETEYSYPQELKTVRSINYACGEKSDDFDLSNTEPLPMLNRFDEFKAADFIIEVEQAEGGNGYFSGHGYTLVPYLGFAKFRVKFDGVFINADKRMTLGEVKFVYDEATGVIGSIGGDDNSDQDEDDEDEVENAEEISDVLIELDDEIEDVIIDGNKIIVIKDDGSTEEYPIDEGTRVGIVEGGKDGKIYVADQNSGQVFTTPKKDPGKGKGSASAGTASQTGDYGCSVQFSVADNQRYGFDQVGNGKNKPDNYFKTRKTGESVAWKSIESGNSDFVNLQVSGSCHPDSLRYVRNSGMLTPSIAKGKKQQLLLTGLSQGEEDLLTVALARTKRITDSTSREVLTEAGALGLVSYDRIRKDVVLIPVNGAQCPQNTGIITKELNEIYSPAVVSWNVSIQPNLEVKELQGVKFEHSGTGTYGKYTSHMRKVIKNFKRERDADNSTFYLFFIDENTATKTGFMPLASQYGFIFNFRTDTHVLAHELGHGKDFNLRHTFSNKAQHYFPERSTQNLMDYAGGMELWKYQWDLIHKPEKILFEWGQDEEEGAMYGNNCVFTEWIEKIRHAAHHNITLSNKTGIAETVKSVRLSNNSLISDIRIYSENGFSTKISKDVVSIEEFNRTGVPMVYFQFGDQVGLSRNYPVHELEIITAPADKQKLQSYLFDKTNWQIKVREHFIDKILKSREASVNFLHCLPDEYYEDLSLYQRMDILHELNQADNLEQKWFGGPDEEGMVIQVIKTTPENQVAELFSKLEENNLIVELYNKVHDIFGKDNQTKLMSELLLLYYSQPVDYIQNCSNYSGRLYLPWSEKQEDGYYEYHVSNYNEASHSSLSNVLYEPKNDDIVISADYNYWSGMWQKEERVVSPIVVSPLTCLAVHFYTPVEFIGLKDMVLPMPAIFFKWMCEEVQERNIEAGMELTLKIASVAIPAAQLVRGTQSIAGTITAVASIVHGTSNIFMELTDSTCEQLRGNSNSRKFCNFWKHLGTAINTTSNINDVISEKIPLFYLLCFTWENMINDPDLNLLEILGAENYNSISNTVNEINEALKI
jgi:hypothetical protein